MVYRHQAKCALCVYVSRASTKKAAQNNLARHVRQKHGHRDSSARDRSMKSARIQAERSFVDHGAPPLKYLVFITCPARLVHKWNLSIKRFAKAGFACRYVHLRHGIDFEAPARLPSGLGRSQFLMYDVHKNFLPMAVKLFAQQRSLQFIFWAEDDCGSRNQSNAKSVLEAAQAISPSAGWLGYLRVNGEPRWQSHMVSFTRWSATAMLHDLNELWSGHATPADFYMALDTYIWRLCGRSDIIRPSPQSLVHQIRSLTSGRRAGGSQRGRGGGE